MADLPSSDPSTLSSPSSGDVESCRGTPGTKATELTPEDSRNEVKNTYPPFALRSVPLKFSPSAEAGHTPNIGRDDPFLTTTSNILTVTSNKTAGIKLSPTAAEFEPLCLADNTAYTEGKNFALHTVARQPISAASQKSAVPSAVSLLSATSVPDFGPENATFANRLASILGGASCQPIGAPAGVNLEGCPPSVKISPAESEVADVGNSRNLKISHLPGGTLLSHLNAIFLVSLLCQYKLKCILTLKDPKPEVIVVTELVSNGIVYVKYADLRDARQVWSALKYSQVDCHVQFISARQFVSMWKPQVLHDISDFEGQLLITSDFSGKRSSFDARRTFLGIQKIFKKYGEIELFDVKALVYPSMTICISYYNFRAAETAICKLNGFKFEVHEPFL